ncbi:MAG: hypothetical protein WKG03_16710 [Telluria sp.]
MLWIITEDHLDLSAHGIPSSVGKMNAPKFRELLRSAPTEAREPMIEGFKQGMTDEFHLFDDDGELYFTGLCLDLDDQDGDSAFGPLDWAMSDSGCTRMDYRKKGAEEWQTL